MKAHIEHDKIDTPFKLGDFKIPDDLQKWINNPFKALGIIRDSGVGKSQFCKAFIKEHGLKALTVNHREDLKRLDDSYDAILFDDFNIHEIDNTQRLAMIDNEGYKTLRVLYWNVTKKTSMIVMITMNKPEFYKAQDFFTQDRVLRRTLLIEPPVPFIINININGTNHVSYTTNQILDGCSSFSEHQVQESLHVKKQKEVVKNILRSASN